MFAGHMPKSRNLCWGHHFSRRGQYTQHSITKIE
jgi:hypothetical protein